jgi:AcrR family transcriptional regulator
MPQISERREEILEKIVDALLTDGVAHLSLRPLAEAAGTSARLLIYHFETKEKMLRCALAIVRARVQASLREEAARGLPATPQAVLLMFWEWATDDVNQRYFRLLFEVDGLSMHKKPGFSKEFHDAGTPVWLQMIDQSAKNLPAHSNAEGRSTLIMAAMNGLMQDLFTTGDRARAEAGLRYLIDMVMSEAPASSNKRLAKQK